MYQYVDFAHIFSGGVRATSFLQQIVGTVAPTPGDPVPAEVGEKYCGKHGRRTPTATAPPLSARLSTSVRCTGRPHCGTRPPLVPGRGVPVSPPRLVRLHLRGRFVCSIEGLMYKLEEETSVRIFTSVHPQTGERCSRRQTKSSVPPIEPCFFVGLFDRKWSAASIYGGIIRREHIFFIRIATVNSLILMLTFFFSL